MEFLSQQLNQHPTTKADIIFSGKTDENPIRRTVLTKRKMRITNPHGHPSGRNVRHRRAAPKTAGRCVHRSPNTPTSQWTKRGERVGTKMAAHSLPMAEWMVATYCGAPLCRPTRYYCNRQAEETVARPRHPRKSHVDDIIGLGLIQTFSHFLKENYFQFFGNF